MWGEGLELGFEPRSLLTTKPMFSLYCIPLCFLWKQVVKILSHRKGVGSLGKAHRSRVSAAVVGSLLSPPLARECFHSRMVLVAFKFML